MKNPLQAQTAQRDDSREIERAIDRLDGWIRKFQVDSQRFLSGDLHLPPNQLQDRIESELRKLRGSKLKGAAHKFRLGALEARFNSLLDLHGRRLRARETAEPQRRVASEERKTTSYDPRRGVIIGRESDAAAVDALYDGLYRKSRKSADPKRFRAYLEHQAEVIRAKTGCTEIQFRLVDKEGKLKLKAKPIRRRAKR